MFPYVDTSADLIEMCESKANFLNLSESGLHLLKKTELVLKMLDLKRYCWCWLTLAVEQNIYIIGQTSLENRKVRSELVITQNINSR